MVTRRSLVERLKNLEDHRSWQDFFDTYWRLIYSVARRAGLTPGEAQEVVQETLITVAKKSGELRYNPALGSFKGWLLHTTRWRIADQFRKRKAPETPLPKRAAVSRRTATIERIPDSAGENLEEEWDEEWHRNILAAALNRLKKKIDAKQYQIFDCYVLKSWPAQKVASELRVSTAQVYLVKHRVGGLLKKEIRALEKVWSRAE